MTLLEKAKHLLTGETAEKDACQYLIQQKLKLICKNYHCRYGEIDLIMQDQQSLVFVEVRYRKHSQFGSGAESITINKQRKLIKTASHYLQKTSGSSQWAARFDVISISPDNKSKQSKIDWIKDAFQA
ncbi:hypothetical protein MNBD_GAMMA23-1315 [hydrothermal vent metagenome]|uniref:Uncharacterized protein n=1 Tax=hydrothermal vent metagenome TaxID=652676 RepID=A0A3B0ZT84_9ZZZZ